MTLEEKLCELLKYFKPSQDKSVYSISEREIGFIIQSDGGKIIIQEVPRLLNKLEKDGYIDFDKDKQDRESKGLPFYKYYSLNTEGEEILKKGEYPQQGFWENIYNSKPLSFWIGVIVALATILSVVLMMI